jgi:hypothetical protein
MRLCRITGDIEAMELILCFLDRFSLYLGRIVLPAAGMVCSEISFKFVHDLLGFLIISGGIERRDAMVSVVGNISNCSM